MASRFNALKSDSTWQRIFETLSSLSSHYYYTSFFGDFGEVSHVELIMMDKCILVSYSTIWISNCNNCLNHNGS